MPFRPMLATDFDEGLLRFPYYASPKLDGIRAVVLDGHALTRTLKRLPNFHAREWFQRHAELLDGLDGELVVGDPTAPDAYRQTASGIMAHGGNPDFRFFVFDVVDRTGRRPFEDRWKEANERADGWPKNVGLLLQQPVADLRSLLRFEDGVVDLGYEGAMIRRPTSLYKQGRATVLDNSLLKVKRFRDAEAEIVGFEERMHNTNPAMRNALGRTQRSSAKAGLVGLGTLGAFVVRGLPGQPFAGRQFSIGGGKGMGDGMRASVWARRDQLRGMHVTYRFFDVGTKDAPRHPQFVAFRPEGT